MIPQDVIPLPQLEWFLTFLGIDPACWPERWKLPRQRIDVRTASNLRSSSRSTSRTCKETERRRCGRSHSNAQVSDGITKYKENKNRANPLSQSATTRKRKEYKLNVRTSESLLRTLIYLAVLSLLAVTDLDTWLASNRTRAIIWSLLDLALLLLSFWLSYLCMVLPSA